VIAIARLVILIAIVVHPLRLHAPVIHPYTKLAAPISVAAAVAVVAAAVAVVAAADVQTRPQR